MTGPPRNSGPELYVDAGSQSSSSCWSACAQPSGSDMICVTRFPGARQLVAPMSLGQRLPMYCSSAGRAYFSCLPSDEARSLLDASSIEARLPTTVTDPEEIWRLVQQVRTDGYATAFQQFFPTDLAFGAPVVDASGRGLGAINISVPSTRWSEEKAVKTFPALIRETARAVSANLRDQSEVN